MPDVPTSAHWWQRWKHSVYVGRHRWQMLDFDDYYEWPDTRGGLPS